MASGGFSSSLELSLDDSSDSDESESLSLVFLGVGAFSGVRGDSTLGDSTLGELAFSGIIERDCGESFCGEFRLMKLILDGRSLDAMYETEISGFLTGNGDGNLLASLSTVFE